MIENDPDQHFIAFIFLIHINSSNNISLTFNQTEKIAHEYKILA
jgi:hypothetical protein